MLRPATTADLPTILRYERDYVRTIEPHALRGWTESIDQNLQLWIECLSTTVVLEVAGSEDADPAGLAMWLVEGEAATLVTIHVAPRHRRSGFGRLLLEAFETRAAAGGSRVLKLGVHRDNPARALYERAGYGVVGTDGDYVLFERRAGDGS
ncbi:GNAT family N-acetyltransferase [Nocardioides aestuarii]|uniref:GNAT family N-acetyltransferase n=1 Tax=Nocardioides aestuarii TaxID=252231 RepID=A0ABW4TI64_9ACTN